jgi:hypothetical protein
MSEFNAADLNTIVVAKATEDAAFRASVVANPKAAMEKLFNQEIPGHITFKLVEEAADQFTIVLPHQSTVGAGGELSDSDLEAVAGGSKSGAKKFFKAVGSAFLDDRGGQAGILAQAYTQKKTCG